MIVLFSDLDMKGSGYKNIAISLVHQLTTRGKKVTVLGLGYNGEEHNWPFSVLPVNRWEWLQTAPVMIGNLHRLSLEKHVEPIDAVVVALDIPLQLSFRALVKQQIGDDIEIPYISIYPVEDGPVTLKWANGLLENDSNMVISQHGKNMLDAAGVDVSYIPIGIDTEAWRLPSEAHNERETIRETMGYKEDDFVIVTVADNQERKNLSAAFEIISAARREHPKIHWHLVTRKVSPQGWNLEDYALETGLTGNLAVWERGISHAELWKLMAMSNLFLLTSKAEGLCMPVMEAMATGVPVLASHCSAILEHIYPDGWKGVSSRLTRKGKRLLGYEGKRGFTIPIAFSNRDVWGNSNRSYVDTKLGTAQLVRIINLWKKDSPRLERIKQAARSYVESRTWDKAGELLNSEIDRLILSTRREQKKVFEAAVPGQPASTPAFVPIIGVQPEQSEDSDG